MNTHARCLPQPRHAERIRERLRRRLKELMERCGQSEHGLARERGIGRDYIGKIDHEVASSARCRGSSTS